MTALLLSLGLLVLSAALLIGLLLRRIATPPVPPERRPRQPIVPAGRDVGGWWPRGYCAHCGTTWSWRGVPQLRDADCGTCGTPLVPPAATDVDPWDRITPGVGGPHA